MTIGVDGNEANVENKVGVSVYTFELLQYFKQVANDKVRFIIYLRTEPNKHLPTENEFYTYRVVKGSFAWSQVFLPISLYLKHDIDVFFSPAHYIPRYCPCPVVVTLHDLSYIYYPQEFLQKDLYKLTHWTAHAVNKAVAVIAVSHNTAQDAQKQYHISDSKLFTVQNGFRQTLTDVKSAKLPMNIKKPYILFVSTLQPRKNVVGLINAYSIMLQKNPNYQLVIAGKKGWLFDELFKRVTELKLEDKIVFTGFVEDSLLKSLYQNAHLFVLPGFYEGFGYPMLEAMYFGCPVVASNTGALPEVGGDAALYFDPKKPDKMAEMMQKVLTSAKIRSELIEKGKKQVAKFSWEKTGQMTLDVIKRSIS